MFKNFLSVTTRNFRRNKVFTIINIAGLAIGISASLVIYLIVHHEFSYGKFLSNGDRVYRVVTNMHFPDADFKNGGIPGVLPAAMRREMPGIEASTQFWMEEQMKVTIPVTANDNKTFRKQDKILFADSLYTSFIGYEFLAGSPASALVGPNKVVLTESRAKIYFPAAELSAVIGQTIVYDDTVKATVTGVVKDLSELSGFPSKEFISLSTYQKQLEEVTGFGEWGSVNSSSQFFIRLKKGTDTAKFNKALAALRKKHEKNAYLATDHLLQAQSDIHFNPDYDVLDGNKGHKPTLYGLLAVAAFLLLLGSINFINLTTAQATQRAKEIGIRKTIGSTKAQLVKQFLGETLLLTTVAATVSIAITPWILKVFGEFIPGNLKFNLVDQPHIIVFLVALIAIVGILAGFYPAMVLSRFKPVMVLKNVTASTPQSRRAYVRKTLTVAQFVIAQFFVIATLIVGKQIRFSLNKDMGFKKDAIINIRTPYNYQNPDNKQFVLQEKLKAIPGIQQMSLAGSPPATFGTSSSTMKFNKDGKDIETTVEIKQADTAYFSLYHMKLLAGRNLQQSDTVREYIVNEHYARFLGFSNPAGIVGKFIQRNNAQIPIVGVLADINTKSVHSAITPLVYTCFQKRHREFHIALAPAGGNTDGWKKVISQVEKAWKEVYPEEEFSYTFFDESIAGFYKKEQRTAGLLNWSAGLTIFISCLGLLGLVIYTTNQRMKEIGVRKVLGATVLQIVSLLSKDFMKLVAIAFIITVPLAWWAMNDWLEDFVYRTTISWWIFAISGGAMLLAALLTLSIRTIRSASANPVRSLRSE
jgi:putative ABC transport system permease protein